MKNLKSFFLSFFLLFSGFVFSQNTHSFTFNGSSIANESVMVQPGDNIKIINGIGTATYGIQVSQDGVNYTQILTGEMNSGVVFDTLIQSSDSDFYLRVLNIFNIPLLTVDVTIDNTASISNNSNDVSFNVYPNPFIDFITIDGFVENVKIFDLNGQIVYQDNQSSEGKTINLFDLVSGNYILLINDRKIIKLVK